MRTLVSVFLVGMISLGGSSAIATKVETIDGVAHVSNSGSAAKGLEVIKLKELWRSGGDDDDIFYGTVGGISTDDDGKVFILDTQQSQVQFYNPDGQWAGTLSQEGEGPGETRNPDGMYLDQAGRICLLTSPVGSIVRVNPDNTPADPLTFSTGEGTDGGVTILLGGSTCGDGLIIASMRLFFEDNGQSRQHYSLSLCDANGLQLKVLAEKDNFINYADFRLDEKNMDFCWSRWVYGLDKRIYIAPERNEYRINVFDVNGNLEKVISRDYSAFERDEYLTRRATMRIEGVATYHGVPLQGLSIEDVEPDIVGMWVDPKGYLWVHTSRGRGEKPEGAYSVYDVFSPDGKFDQQVAVMCDAEPYKDSLQHLDDGRIVVVLSSLDAWLTQQNVKREENEDQEIKTLEIVVYE